MLSKVGLAILDVLNTGQEATIKELAEETGHSQNQVYRVVDDLLEVGLLTESRGHHNRRVVRATDGSVVESYRRLTSKLAHVEWIELLSPATTRACWYLDTPRRVTTIADRLGITRQAVHKALSPLKNRAMLSPSGPEYALADDLRPLLEFTQAVVLHEHRTRVRNHAPSAIIEWSDPNRALAKVQEPEDTNRLQEAPDWKLTGLARFQEFGLQFFLAGEPAFWYAPDEALTPAEIVCHTLVLGAGSRRVSYAMLLIEQEKIEYNTLMNTAEWYDLERTISDMYRLIDEDDVLTDEISTPLPSSVEYATLKDQYGVA